MTRAAASEAELRPLLRRLPPALGEGRRKGDAGRVAVVGGWEGSTGAPYLAGVGALRCGADQALVFCTRRAAAAIGAHSPELLVLPFLDAEHGRSLTTTLLAEVQTLVVGPGLGEDVAVLALVLSIVEYVRDSKTLGRMALVFDGDGLGLLADNKHLLVDYAGPVYLTPNANEIDKLAAAYLGRRGLDVRDHAALSELAARVNGKAVLIVKGPVDQIVVEGAVYTCSMPGGLRRFCGQGDLLAGFLGVLAYWATLLEEGGGGGSNDDDEERRRCPVPGQAIAAYAACALTRLCSRHAFHAAGRSAIASDMIGHIPKAFVECFDPDSS